MLRIFTAVGALVAIEILVVAANSPASAISADLAKKCRDMAIKAHPYKLPGEQGPGTAGAQRDYFSVCISKGGDMPSEPPATDQNASGPSPAPASPNPAQTSPSPAQASPK
jgi:hypothetical protein